MLKNVVKKLSAVLAVSAMALVVFPASFKAFPPTVKDLEDYNWDEKVLCKSIQENAALAAALDYGRFTRDEYCQARDKYINADLSKLQYEELANNVPMVVLAAYTTANGAPDAISYGFSDGFANLNDCLFSAGWCHDQMQKQLCTKHCYIAAGAKFDEKTGFFRIPEERNEEEDEEEIIAPKLSLSLTENFVFEKKSNDEPENDTEPLTPAISSSYAGEQASNLGNKDENATENLSYANFNVDIVEEEEDVFESDTEPATATLLNFAVEEQDNDQEAGTEHTQVTLVATNLGDDIEEEEEDVSESDTETSAPIILDFAAEEQNNDREAGTENPQVTLVAMNLGDDIEEEEEDVSESDAEKSAPAILNFAVEEQNSIEEEEEEYQDKN